MLDRDIRPTLLREVLASHPDAAVFQEFPVCRKGRADMAAINAAMWGFEIKSERDSLSRLPLQVAQYDYIFDYSIVVVAERHLSNVVRIIPRYWGVMSVSGTVGNCVINEVRKPSRNKNRSAEQIIRLLWKGECTKVLRAKGICVPKFASVRTIWSMLQNLPVDELDESIRGALRDRRSIESDLQQMSGDDLSTIVPIGKGLHDHSTDCQFD